MANFVAGQLAAVLAIPEHHHPVGEAGYFAQSVGDVHDAHAAGPKVLDDSEQVLGLAGGQARGRFIHDEHPGLGGQGLGDFHELLLTNS